MVSNRDSWAPGCGWSWRTMNRVPARVTVVGHQASQFADLGALTRFAVAVEGRRPLLLGVDGSWRSIAVHRRVAAPILTGDPVRLFFISAN